jgi:hypothetical protein
VKLLDKNFHYGSSECLENILSHSFEDLSNTWFFTFWILRNIYKIFCRIYHREKRRSVVKNGTSFHLSLSTAKHTPHLRDITIQNTVRFRCQIQSPLKFSEIFIKYFTVYFTKNVFSSLVETKYTCVLP